MGVGGVNTTMASEPSVGNQGTDPSSSPVPGKASGKEKQPLLARGSVAVHGGHMSDVTGRGEPGHGWWAEERLRSLPQASFASPATVPSLGDCSLCVPCA